MRTTRTYYVFGLLGAILLVLGAIRVLQQNETDSYYFGTLQTDPAKAQVEYASGVGVAHLQLDWARFEPTDGTYGSEYAASIKDALRTFRETGMRVELGLGLNDPPPWLKKAHPEALYVNQHGERHETAPNLVFSQAVRTEVEEYMGRVAKEIGLENFWAIRVGVSESGEFSYPGGNSGQRDEAAYWAFDKNAQGVTPDTGRPSTIQPSPFPEWRPGERTYKGKPFTERQVEHWYNWYLASLSDAVNWQINHYRAMGYEGRLKVLIPGAGYYPADHRAAIRDYLDGPVAARLVGQGAGFYETIGHIQDRSNVDIVSTALVDGTGNVPNNGCELGDEAVNIHAREATAVRDWSSVRWISNIAKRQGFTQLSGESAGQHVASYYPGVMEDAVHQMKTCGLSGLMWAFDKNLYDGTPGSSLREFADVIDRQK